VDPRMIKYKYADGKSEDCENLRDEPWEGGTW